MHVLDNELTSTLTFGYMGSTCWVWRGAGLSNCGMGYVTERDNASCYPESYRRWFSSAICSLSLEAYSLAENTKLGDTAEGQWVWGTRKFERAEIRYESRYGNQCPLGWVKFLPSVGVLSLEVLSFMLSDCFSTADVTVTDEPYKSPSILIP